MREKHSKGSAPPTYDDVTAGFTPDWLSHRSNQFNQQTSYQHSPQPSVQYITSGVQVRVPMQQQPIVSTTAVIVAPPANYGPYSQHLICPACGDRIQTNVIHENNYITHVWAGMLCLMGCFLCSCIPYFIDNCKNKNHYCPSCNAYLGTYLGINSRF